MQLRLSTRLQGKRPLLEQYLFSLDKYQFIEHNRS